MFGLEDFFKFFQGFFIVLPLVTLIHMLGHITFVFLFGGKGVRIILGSGKKLFALKFIEVRKFYFSYGGAEYSSLKIDNKLSNTLIFFGGSLFNIISAFTANTLVAMKYLEESIIWYQFIYFSFYFVFFALFPMEFPDGHPSDGKTIYQIWRNRKMEKTSEDCHMKTN